MARPQISTALCTEKQATVNGHWSMVGFDSEMIPVGGRGGGGLACFKRFQNVPGHIKLI